MTNRKDTEELRRLWSAMSEVEWEYRTAQREFQNARDPYLRPSDFNFLGSAIFVAGVVVALFYILFRHK